MQYLHVHVHVLASVGLYSDMVLSSQAVGEMPADATGGDEVPSCEGLTT